jgi:hypothetical protein
MFIDQRIGEGGRFRQKHHTDEQSCGVTDLLLQGRLGKGSFGSSAGVGRPAGSRVMCLTKQTEWLQRSERGKCAMNCRAQVRHDAFIEMVLRGVLRGPYLSLSNTSMLRCIPLSGQLGITRHCETT